MIINCNFINLLIIVLRVIMKKRVECQMNYKIGEEIIALVTGIESYGIFVNTDDGYSGLIHISEISSNYVRNIKDYVKDGEYIKAKVLEIDKGKKQLKLSIKGLDYRINKKNKSKIEETGSGFLVLKENLDKWILEKEEEIKRESLKK